jgi:hypothetical protein
MRWVSWIVVMGALAWLLYTQLWEQVPEQHIEGMTTERLRGTIASANDEAAEKGLSHTVSYDAIYPMIEAANTLENPGRIKVDVIVRSRSRDVDPGAILLSLDDGSRVHSFPVDPYGKVAIPLRQDWRGRGFLIESNQPAGTLELRFPSMETPEA